MATEMIADRSRPGRDRKDRDADGRPLNRTPGIASPVGSGKVATA